jgi:hypothetical protein
MSKKNPGSEPSLPGLVICNRSSESIQTAAGNRACFIVVIIALATM